MKNIWCKLFGHKYQLIFIKGFYGRNQVNYIGATCSRRRCQHGLEEINGILNKLDSIEMCTYNEKHWHNDEILTPIPKTQNPKKND